MIPCPEPRGYSGNLGKLFDAHDDVERPAIVDLYDAAQPRAWGFRELDAACDACARGLVKAGLKPGDRVGILSLNRIEFVIALFGTMRAGLVPVPINIKLAAETVAFVLCDASARLVFTEPALKRLVPAGFSVVEFGVPGKAGFDAFLDPGPFDAFEPAPDSVAIQPYTSGSTGRPKGVLLTHYGQNWSRLILAHTRGTTEHDVVLVAAPLYHKNALNAIKQGLTAGATLPLLPQFSVERYIDAIGRYRCTVISSVPTMISMVLARKDLLEKIDTTSVRTVMMGSAPASPQLLADVRRAFPRAEPLVVYGVTEGGPVPLGPHPEGKPGPPGSIGAPYAGTEAKLVGGTSPDEGELMVKNPGILLAYHNLPQETARCLRDGWYYTGDICRRDADGFYYYVGRTDDMFVSGGENIYPGEVEALLARHPAVHQAFVMPFDHEMKGQVPYAFVVPRAGAQLTEDEVKQFALANGPAYQHPRRVFFLKELPLAGTNKIDSGQLRRWVAEGAGSTTLN
ncbi:MAG TPA: class I adenylate-forming enzyme family protein [Burkholderiales bacterium]|jgi:acyl-CoA synthetase (AMP-forming)/AMP-acid ligase II|nr:class I adenylate-forming enzyme family protein [Burkholderiales bacterium]